MEKKENIMKNRGWYFVSLLLFLGIWGCNTAKKAASVAGVDKSAAVKSSPSASAVQSKESAILSIDSRFLDKDSLTTRVYLMLNAVTGTAFMRPEEFVAAYSLNYVIYADYGSRERLGYGNVPLKEAEVKSVGDKLLLAFDVKKPKKESGLLLTEITENISMKKMLNDLPVRFKTSKLGDGFGLFDGDGKDFLQRNYVREGERIRVKSLSDVQRKLFVFYYNHEFEAAGSPMNTAPRPASRSLKVDSTFTIESDQPISFSKEGLYYFVSDTMQTEGIGLLVVNERYPKMTYPEQLIRPLMYMSTNVEIKELQGAKEFKKSLDKYWLTLMGGNQDLAKVTISNYYRRVEEANRLFTTYKEGWKTDKGMIYIILGNPDKVQRGKDREVWVYNQRASANNINFTFNRRTNQFVYEHYELVRYQEYQPIWYPLVESWRTGAIR